MMKLKPRKELELSTVTEFLHAPTNRKRYTLPLFQSKIYNLAQQKNPTLVN